MRKSIFSRSVLAVATIAVGAGALAGTPAGADTPSGITASTVVSAALLTRAGPPPGSSELVPEALRATKEILVRSCDLQPGEVLEDDDFFAEPVRSGRHADGLLAMGLIGDSAHDTSRTCIVGATAVKGPSSSLSGNATLTVDISRGDATSTAATTAASVLTGDVVITGPISVPGTDTIDRAMFSAEGQTAEKKTTTETVLLKKSLPEMKNAKRVYTKQVKSAKKTYVKAAKKAAKIKSKTKSARKKAAAKKTYAASKKRAKAKYTTFIASRNSVTRDRIYFSRNSFSIATAWVYLVD